LPLETVEIAFLACSVCHGVVLFSPVVLHAELVSDVAAGGQVLMDEATFKIIKDSLSVLGTVQ